MKQTVLVVSHMEIAEVLFLLASNLHTSECQPAVIQSLCQQDDTDTMVHALHSTEITPDSY